MQTQNDIGIVQGSEQFVGFTMEIYQLIKAESERNNMLAKDANDIKLETIAGKSFLAFLGNELTGYVAVFPWQESQLTEICSLVVKEKHRGRGIGTDLVEKAYRLAKKLYPESQVVALANQNSRDIFSKQGLTYLPKRCLPKELWDICPQCKDYYQLPACHCRGMIERQRNKRYYLEPLTPNSEHVVGTAKVYCDVWKEPPWNEHFWTVEGVTADIQRELNKRNACGYVMLNQTKVVSFTWGYEANRDELAEISGNRKLDIIFSGNKRVFYVDELGTLSQYRLKSLGKEISWQLLSAAEEKGLDLAVLRTEKKAIAARALYEKLGFKELPVSDEQHKTRSYWVLNLKPIFG